jgi:small-conductance mechanosensitive channel
VLADVTAYPVTLEGRLDRPMRGLWLIKWLLIIPHAIVLFFLWIAFFLLTIVAFFAILITARYPRPIFDFNLGVLRWTWRVGYYSYSALATDKYPPFTLGPAPDYPASLDVAYPERLSRGLVLVKWWLLAIPHYIVLAVFLGANYPVYDTTSASGTATGVVSVSVTGLLTILVLFAAVVLLFKARYPEGMFAFVVGINRWVYRVTAYAALMTDEYPPFRLDQGGTEPQPEPVTPEPAQSGAR